MVTPGPDKVPVSDGRGTSFLDFEKHVPMGMRATKTELANRAPPLALKINSALRQVCVAAGGDYLGDQNGLARILDMPRNYFAADTADAIRQQVMRFMRFRSAERVIDEFAVQFDFLRR